MNFTIDKQEKYTTIKVHVEKLDTTVAPALKSELVMLNAHGAILLAHGILTIQQRILKKYLRKI